MPARPSAYQKRCLERLREVRGRASGVVAVDIKAPPITERKWVLLGGRGSGESECSAGTGILGTGLSGDEGAKLVPTRDDETVTNGAPRILFVVSYWRGQGL